MAYIVEIQDFSDPALDVYALAGLAGRFVL